MNEEWKEFEDGYEVSNHGRVRSYRRKGGAQYKGEKIGPKLLKQHFNHHNYPTISVMRDQKKKKFAVHRLVLENFLGPCPKEYEASHLNGNRQDNCINNLIWESRKENHLRKKHHGTFQNGEKIGTSKLKEEDVLSIRMLLEVVKLTQKQIADIYNITPATVSQIKRRYTWKHI